jgi:sigma-E factor negative regulatory protein RseA
MKKINASNNEHISALVDGRLQREDFARTMADMASQPDDVATWHLYHLIGDVLRSEDLAVGTHGDDFLARLEGKLALEVIPVVVTAEVPLPVVTKQPSANADVLRWKWVAGLAASALVSVVGVSLWNQTTATSLQATAAAADAQIFLRDPQLDALMTAHQQLGGHSALQTPSGFLRNATFERPAR